MLTRTRSRVRAGTLSVTTATALAAALAAPATAAPSEPAVADAASSSVSSSESSPSSPTPLTSGATSSAPSSRVVTLVTGDRVLLRTDGTGRTTASLTPRSPHYGKRVEHLSMGSHVWVVPKLALSVRRHLDASVFDVAALSGRVPLAVTFSAGASPRALPGLDVRPRTARTSASGRTTVSASYDASRPLPATFGRALTGVQRIAVESAPAPQIAPPPTYNLQTLTVNGTNVNGRKLRFADTVVLNVDDGRLFGAFGELFHGQWKVSVPSGHYLIVSNDFRHIVVSQVEVGDTDTSVDFSMADATVKPKLTLPDHRQLDPAIDLVGQDARKKGSFDFGFSGFLPKVSPVDHLAVGTLDTEVADLWAPKGYHQFTFHHHQFKQNPLKSMAAAKQLASGIPQHLTFHYRPGDFAKVAIKHYATGQKQGALDGFFGISPVDTFAFVQLFPSLRPGVIHGMYLGSRSISWNSLTTLSRSFASFSQVEQAEVYHAGQHAVVPFFRGPVTPVADSGLETKAVRATCALCVRKGNLTGFMSLLTAAGTKQFGISDRATWDLVSRHSRLDHGRFVISPLVRNAEAGKELRLLATTSPGNRKVGLSTHVSDMWQFTVPAKDATIPILRASYVPPTDLESVGKAGRVAFPITFDNLGPADSRVTHASVQWSVDGTSWHAASLRRKDGNTFRVGYANPAATKAHRTLSLRITAEDAGGRRMSEEVQDAYFLPRGRAGGTTHHHAAATPRHVNRFVPNKLCRTTTTSQYSCFVKLSPATRDAGKASPDPAGWGAPALRQAYDLGTEPAPSTVAVVVAFDYPHAQSDMNHYRAQFGLPACTSASGCFTKLNQKGEAGNYPDQDFGWGVEASLDLQMISTSCPTCHIVLVEANQPVDKAFGHAEQAAVNAGATVTNHSFGRLELTGTDTQAALYDHPGVTAVASSGDFGYGPASFPASSPSVVAVGGTTLARSTTDPRGWREKAWRFAGSGCSAYFDKVAGQTDPSCHMRSVADVSAVSEGLAVYNTSLPRRFQGWLEVDGTSASSPLISGMIGAVGRGGMRPADLYAGPADAFNDVTAGSNGFCRGSYICTGAPGYDGPTGLGTPKGVASFGLPPL